MAYEIKLNHADIAKIEDVGDRHEWSRVIPYYLGIGDNVLNEMEALDLKEAFEDDTKRGHDFFPMLRRGSLLYRKLAKLYESIARMPVERLAGK